jgi:hypothetical protein
MEDLKRQNRALLFALALSIAFNLLGLEKAKNEIKKQKLEIKKCLIE